MVRIDRSGDDVMRQVLVLLMVLWSTGGLGATEADRLQTILKEKCSHCHGNQGEASSEIYPRLAAQNYNYIAKQLRNFRDGARLSDTMNEMAKDLSDGDIELLAGHFSRQPPLSHRIISMRKELAAVGAYIFNKGNKYAEIPSCASCHGDKGEGNENLPRLAGQHKRYVVAQLRAFHERKRTNDNAVMHTIAKKLTELEINAVALFISGLKSKELQK